jgi:spermidine synthase
MVTVSPARQERAGSYSSTSLWLISLCFIFSGATGLIYEVLWARMLGLVFGATTFAISAVLAAFMGGLALGSALAGRLAARIKRPLRAYGIIEILIALYALLVPVLFRWIDYLYAILWEQFRPGFYSFSLWRFVLSSAVLLIPTTLMGATLPVLSAALLRSPAHTEASVTRLYSFNLVGAIFGTLSAGFLLLPLLGVRATIYTAAVINIIIGIFAFIIDRRDAQTTTSDDEVAQTFDEETRARNALPEDEGVSLEENVSRQDLGSVETGSTKFWLLCAGVSGFVTISTQVAWTRLLTMVIGSSTYAFSMVVALFILGLYGGAYFVGRRKNAENLRRAMMKVELDTAISLYVSIWIVNLMPLLLITLGTGFKLSSWGGLLALQTFVAAMLILIPAFLMGMVMPLVLMWASNQGRDSVRLVGKSYAVNTLGAIAGAFFTGFILIPKASTRFTIICAAALCIIVAGIAYLPAGENVDRAVRRTLAISMSLVLIIALVPLSPYFRVADLSVGAYDGLVRVLAKSRFGGGEAEEEKRGPEKHELLMYKEGPTATVSVREDWGIRSLAINGRTNASDKGDMPTQVILGQMPLLVAPRTDNGLIVGLASGVSVGSMLQSEIKSLECVELEPTTIEASRFFEHVNNRPLEDARMRLIIDDARTYLRVTPARYDMIVSEPSHPWVPGVANLFTKEFFELGRSRLRDDGVFVQWVQIYQLSTESLRSVLATYKSVFPHVLMFRVGGATRGKDLILVGSRAPLNLDRVEERLKDTRIAAELARINIKSKGDIEAWYVCDDRQLGPALSGASINTDDNMLIEHRAPREAFKPLMDDNAAWIEKLANEAR